MGIIEYGVTTSVVLLVLGVLLYIKMLHRCDSDKVMVKSGAFIGNDNSCKIYMGGTTIVVPLLQSIRYMSRAPLSISINMEEAISKNKIRVKVPCNFQVALSEDKVKLRRAASTVVAMTNEEIKNKVKEILTGGLRAVIAKLTIEEINDDRNAFIKQVDEQVDIELSKLGYEITNVNIEEIDDEAGYLKALGQKAASAALNKANVEVAEQDRLGQVGVQTNESQRDVQIEEQETKRAVGKADAKRERDVKVAEMESKTAVEKIEFEKENLQAQAELAVADAEAKRSEEVAKSQAQQKVLEEQKKEEKLRLEKETVVEKEIAKKEKMIEAEADAEAIKIRAAADAEAILIKAEAEAKGVEAVLKAQAEGYKNLFTKENSEAVLAMEQLKIAENLETIRAKAIAGIKIDEIKVVDSGSGSAVPSFVEGLVNSFPKAHAIGEAIGVTLPGILGTKNETPPKKSDEVVEGNNSEEPEA